MSLRQNSVVGDIVTSIQKCDESTSSINTYKVVSVAASAALASLYVARYRTISKHTPQGYSEDFKSLTVLIVSLCVWNAGVCVFSDSLILNLKTFGKLIATISDPQVENELNGFLSNTPDVFSRKNLYVLVKDLRIFAFALVSMLLFKNFANTISKAIEYVAFLKNSAFYHHVPNQYKNVSLIEDDDIEKLLSASPSSSTSSSSSSSSSSPSPKQSSDEPFDPSNGHKLKKKVSFDSTTTTYNYSESELSVIKDNVSSSMLLDFVRHNHRKILERVIFFSVTLFAFVIITPSELLLNSSSFLYSSASFVIKFDHIYFTIITLFFCDVVAKFIKVANHPNFQNFPFLTSMASHFTWGYCSLILAGSVGLIVLLSDVLINVIGLIAQTIISYSKMSDSSSSTFPHDYDGVPRQFFTSIVLNYLQHSIGPLSCPTSASNAPSCSIDEYVDALTKSFIWVKMMLTNCWIVTNFTCFLLLPIFIWIVIIEFKIGYNKSDHF